MTAARSSTRPASTSPAGPKFYAVVPAAGVGRRMGGPQPKQYLHILGRPVIEHTLNKLLAIGSLEKIVVAISAQDDHWPQLALAGDSRIETVIGGAERSDSVLNGLQHLAQEGSDNDWVLVHDVARPCVATADIEAMMDALRDHEVGGILAVPASDTIKRVDGNAIIETVDRTVLWQAQTPQMFRLGLLRGALANGISSGASITDEASAIELAGARPVVFEGTTSNIKITRPEDLALAEYFCARQSREERQQ